jgi:hypothetical protein
MSLSEPLRAKLLAAGHKRLDVDNAELHLATGKITRKLRIDGTVVAEPEFPTIEIDWGIIEEALA